MVGSGNGHVEVVLVDYRLMVGSGNDNLASVLAVVVD